MDQPLTVEQVAAYLNVSPWSCSAFAHTLSFSERGLAMAKLKGETGEP